MGDLNAGIEQWLAKMRGIGKEGISGGAAPTAPTTDDNFERLSNSNHNLSLVDHVAISFISGHELKDLAQAERIIIWLAVASSMGVRLTRFDVKQSGVDALHSVVSDIHNHKHLAIERRWLTRESAWGAFPCVEYWLNDESMRLAEQWITRIVEKKSAVVVVND